MIKLKDNHCYHIERLRWLDDLGAIIKQLTKARSNDSNSHWLGKQLFDKLG